MQVGSADANVHVYEGERRLKSGSVHEHVHEAVCMHVCLHVGAV